MLLGSVMVFQINEEWSIKIQYVHHIGSGCWVHGLAHMATV